MNSTKVIELNNNAVCFLRMGRYKQATDLLRTAIAGLRTGFVENNQEVDFSEPSVNTKLDAPSSASLAAFTDDDNADNTSFVDVEQTKQGMPAILSSVPLWTEDSNAQKHDKSLIFVYAQALVLAPIDHRRRILIGVVLYNMALTNHVLAIEQEKSSLLMVALKFYGMAVAIVRGHNDGGVKASSYWLLLALYNNMAQIHMSYSSSEKMQHCLGNIEVLFAADRVEHLIDVDDYAFFLTNAMLQLRVVATPAA